MNLRFLLSCYSRNLDLDWYAVQLSICQSKILWNLCSVLERKKLSLSVLIIDYLLHKLIDIHTELAAVIPLIQLLIAAPVLCSCPKHAVSAKLVHCTSDTQNVLIVYLQGSACSAVMLRPSGETPAKVFCPTPPPSQHGLHVHSHEWHLCYTYCCKLLFSLKSDFVLLTDDIIF